MALNCHLDAEGRRSEYCSIWNLHEPGVLMPLRMYDQRRFRQGLPWTMHLPLLVRFLFKVGGTVRNMMKKAALLHF